MLQHITEADRSYWFIVQASIFLHSCYLLVAGARTRPSGSIAYESRLPAIRVTEFLAVFRHRTCRWKIHRSPRDSLLLVNLSALPRRPHVSMFKSSDAFKKGYKSAYYGTEQDENEPCRNGYFGQVAENDGRWESNKHGHGLLEAVHFANEDVRSFGSLRNLLQKRVVALGKRKSRWWKASHSRNEWIPDYSGTLWTSPLAPISFSLVFRAIEVELGLVAMPWGCEDEPASIG